MTAWHQTDKTTHELRLQGVVIATITAPESAGGFGLTKASKPRHRCKGVIDWDKIETAAKANTERRAEIDADTLKDAKLRVNGRLGRHGAQRYCPPKLDSAPIPPKKAAPRRVRKPKAVA